MLIPASYLKLWCLLLFSKAMALLKQQSAKEQKYRQRLHDKLSEMQREMTELQKRQSLLAQQTASRELHDDQTQLKSSEQGSLPHVGDDESGAPACKLDKATQTGVNKSSPVAAVSQAEVCFPLGRTFLLFTNSVSLIKL